MVSAERKVKPDHSRNAGLKIGGSLSGADLVCDIQGSWGTRVWSERQLSE